jgi:hypothetical protein
MILPRKDLVVLVPDKNMEASLRGLLSRCAALGLREVAFDLFVHPERDPGCLLKSHQFLLSFTGQYDHALVLLDKEGCGREGSSRDDLEAQVEDRLSQSGWEERAAAVVIAPELEVWIWNDSPHVGPAFGLGKDPKDWLQDGGFLQEGQIKPVRPKEAVERALRLAHRPRSSAIYLELAQRVSTSRCVDPAFLKLKRTLASWFPPQPRAESAAPR